MQKKEKYEYLFGEYLNHPKIKETKNYSHHGINRYDHSYRVGLHTYNITKTLHLNYESATKAAILHDFFLDEVDSKNAYKKLKDHPNVAVENSKKYFSINEMEEDIIKKHMFPITFSPPKYIEGWIVDIVDDYISIYERVVSISKRLQFNINFIIIITFICKLFYPI